MSRAVLVGMLLAGIQAVAVAQSPESVTAAAASIQAADILHRIGVISDDSMRGRQTPSPGLEMTARFIAGQFQGFGLAPGGDSGSFLQRYPLRQNGVDTAGSSLTITDGPVLRFGRDLVPAGASRDAEASGKLVLLSGARPDEALLAKLGLAEKIVVISLPPDDPGGRKSTLVQNLPMISGQHPAAVVLVTPMSDAQWRATARGTMSERITPGWTDNRSDAVTGLAIVAARSRAVEDYFTRHGADLAAAAKYSGAPTVMALEGDARLILHPAGGARITAPNVVGILEGSDSILKHEYIVFSGHMDHVGVGQPDARGDSIYNGADDDASGTTAVIELAEAFSKLKPRPKRSLIFLTVSGEERGLWGSEYFTTHPPVPITQIVADLNSDMVGRNWKDTIVAIGKEHSDLGATLNRVNQQHPELHMTAIDDIWPEESFYTRSDHYNFARRGVPILFFFNGVHADYHQPGDEVSKIDGEKESRIVKLVFYLGLEVANRAEKPRWKPESYRKIVEEGR